VKNRLQQEWMSKVNDREKDWHLKRYITNSDIEARREEYPALNKGGGGKNGVIAQLRVMGRRGGATLNFRRERKNVAGGERKVSLSDLCLRLVGLEVRMKQTEKNRDVTQIHWSGAYLLEQKRSGGGD